jgi:hypothetical protein
MSEHVKQLPFDLLPESHVRESRFEETVRSTYNLYKITKEGKQCT